MKKIVVGFGTRPEVIKLAPVIKSLEKNFNVFVLHTGQHRELVSPLLRLFGIMPDMNLEVMEPGQDLFSLTTALMPSLKECLTQEKPDYVIVQGDTTSSYLIALAAFYLKIPVLHVEAGLRSGNALNPFPEEVNRKLISHLAQVHFAPTELNKQSLLNEGINKEQIFVTGNTVIDALNLIRESKDFEQSSPEILTQISPDRKLAVLTAHRRENHGEPLQNVFLAVKSLLEDHSKLEVVFPAHPNPEVRKALQSVGLKHDRFHLTEPIDYLSFLHVMMRADFILTDSGGIQEEASALGKPVLVLRNETERQELIDSGMGKLVGTDPVKIKEEAQKLLTSDGKETSSLSIFGDGNSADRISKIIASL